MAGLSPVPVYPTGKTTLAPTSCPPSSSSSSATRTAQCPIILPSTSTIPMIRSSSRAQQSYSLACLLQHGLLSTLLNLSLQPMSPPINNLLTRSTMQSCPHPCHKDPGLALSASLRYHSQQQRSRSSHSPVKTAIMFSIRSAPIGVVPVEVTGIESHGCVQAAQLQTTKHVFRPITHPINYHFQDKVQSY